MYVVGGSAKFGREGDDGGRPTREHVAVDLRRHRYLVAVTDELEFRREPPADHAFVRLPLLTPPTPTIDLSPASPAEGPSTTIADVLRLAAVAGCRDVRALRGLAG